MLKITALITTLGLFFAAPVFAAPVLQTSSGICHCAGGEYYDQISRGQEHADLRSCLANGGREPKRGQGDCSGSALSSAAPVRSEPTSLAGRPYERSEFGHGWLDANGDCMNTRHEQLRDTATGRVSVSRDGCYVVRGRWNDPYTGKIFTEARDMDMDHIVPLSYAWKHGADAWDREKRERFANDPVNLIAVDASTNRQKSDSGPLKWLPPNVGYRCEYVLRFMRISQSYDLVFSASEANDMTELAGFLCN